MPTVICRHRWMTNLDAEQALTSLLKSMYIVWFNQIQFSGLYFISVLFCLRCHDEPSLPGHPDVRVLPQSIESISSKKSSLLWHDYTLFTVMSFYFGPCCWYFVRITEVLRTFFLCTLLDHVRPFYWLGHVFTLGPPRHVTSCRDEDSDDAMVI